MDSGIFSYLISGVVVIAVVSVLVLFMGRKKNSSSEKRSSKNQSQIIRDANRKLAKNPHDPAGLIPLGDIYFANKLWDKAYPVYDELSKLSMDNPSIDVLTSWLRLGICAVMLKKNPEGIAALTSAYKIDPHGFEVNYYLGKACFDSEQYEKAIPCFKKAIVARPEAEGVYLLLGQSMYKSHKFRDSLPCFRKALDEDPSNKEALFDMADAMTEEGHGEKAIKVFMHLRPDPVYGARSCLAAGLFHSKTGDLESAIQDYEIGLKHESAPVQTKLEISYNLARCYFGVSNIAKGVALLKSIRNINENYKDVNALITRYQELSQNKNLQIYLSSNSSDFVTLCRKFIAKKYSGSSVKIQSIDVDQLFTDILAEIYTPKWEDVVLFRFFRTSSVTGEMYVRDFHGHMQDVKAARGFCVSAGTFTAEAHKYTEGRPLDLIEKNDLSKVLKQISI